MHNSTVPLAFETYPKDIYTIPLIRKHQDSYFNYIDIQSLVETPDEPSFSIPFTSPLNSDETFCKNIIPTNIYIPIAHVFTGFLKNVSKKIDFLHQHAFNPSAKQALLQKESLLTFLIYNNSAPSKISPIIGSLPIFFKSTTLKYQ